MLEEEKAKIRSQLTKSKSLKSNQSERKEAPDFFKDYREQFITKMTEMGYEYDQIDDYLEEHGLCEMNVGHCIETIGKPHFKNPLYIKPESDSEEEKNDSQINYDYVNLPDINAHKSQLPPISHFSQAPQGQNPFKHPPSGQ